MYRDKKMQAETWDWAIAAVLDSDLTINT